MSYILDGVVNDLLEVHSTRNVRIVNASIVHVITLGNVHATVYAIVERACDLMKQDRDNGLIGTIELVNEVQGESTDIIHAVQETLVSSSLNGEGFQNKARIIPGNLGSTHVPLFGLDEYCNFHGRPAFQEPQNHCLFIAQNNMDSTLYIDT